MSNYVGAPYNFVPFSEKVIVAYESEEQLPKHNEYTPGHVSGVIRYTVEAQTPIFIGDGQKEEGFYKDITGREALPGSTMRGLVRSNMTVLGGAAMGHDIDDYRLMYRDITNNYYKDVLGTKQDRKTQISVIENVKAGYIANEGGKFVIYPNVKDMYYTVSERTHVAPHKENFRDFWEKFQNDVHSEYERRGRRWVSQNPNKKYVPFWEMCNDKQDVLYQLDDQGHVIGLKRAEAGTVMESKYEKGSVLSSGKMNNGKKVFYVIPEMSKDSCIKVSADDVSAFQRDYQMRKKTLGEKNAPFYDLPTKKEKIKPVFYIQLNGRLYFGFTPRLRIFYDKTIGDGIPKAHKAETLDYVKAIFGYAEKDKAYRSRVSFSDATLCGEVVWGERANIISAEPKPTSHWDYLYQRDYNEKHGQFGYNGDFTLRGMKQYWGHKNAQGVSITKNKEVNHSIVPLDRGVKFEGSVRFDNLSEIELGLLLWSLALEKNSCQNVGKAKAYGFGRVRVSIDQLEVLSPEKLYQSDTLSFDGYEDWTEEVETFVQKTKDELGTNKWESVKNFFLIKEKILADEKVRYMSISNEEKINEYQNRKNSGIPLGTIPQVIAGETPTSLKPQKSGNGGSRGGYPGKKSYGNNYKRNNNRNGGYGTKWSK